MTQDWKHVRSEFEPDGSLRDIYVLNANAELWNQLLSSLEESRYQFRFFTPDGAMSPAPRSFEEIDTLKETDPVRMEIQLPGGLSLNCHFFSPSEIELDLDPKEIYDQKTYAFLGEFMRWLAFTLGREALLTHENSKEVRILAVKANAA